MGESYPILYRQNDQPQSPISQYERMFFVLSVIASIIGIVLLSIRHRDDDENERRRKKKEFDIWGGILLAIGVIGLIFFGVRRYQSYKRQNKTYI